MPLGTYETWEAQLPLLDRAWAQVQRAYSEQRYNIIEDSIRLSAPDVVKRQKRRQLPRKHRWPLLEKGRRCFLDVGAWQGKPDGIARTDFGLVSGRDVLLCSWLNIENGGRGRKHYDRYCCKNRVQFSQKISDFFDMPKGAILGHFVSSEPLVSGDELIIFLPDLHLHLCKETVIDNFKYNRNLVAKGEKPKIVSLEDELAELLERGQSLDAEIIQVGDCFEMWELQAHLVKDYECIGNYRETGVIRGMQIGQPTLQDIWNKMWRERKAMPRDDYQYEMREIQHQARAAEAFGVSRPLTEEHVDRLGVPVDDTYDGPMSQVDVIRNRIMAKYPSIFENEKLKTGELGIPFRWLRGNHDNMRANLHYEKVEEKDYKFSHSRIIKPAGKPPEELTAYDIYRGGIDGCLWAEHGHRLDSKNADSVFYLGSSLLDGNGYYCTKFFTTGRLIGEAGWRQGAIELAVQEATERIGYYMRGDQLKSVYSIFRDNEDVRLVVMGHTHTPALVDWGIFLRWILCRTYSITCPK